MTMMKRRLSLFVILSLLFSMIGLESYAEYRSFPNQKVASDKVFVIRFNDIVDRSNLNPGSIRVQGEEGDIAVTIENGSDGRSLIIQPPAEGYMVGKTYTLIIQNVTNDNGKILKQSVQMQFDIEEKEEKKEEQQEMPALPPSAPSLPGSGGGSGSGPVAPTPPAVSNPDPVLPSPLPPVLPESISESSSAEMSESGTSESVLPIPPETDEESSVVPPSSDQKDSIKEEPQTSTPEDTKPDSTSTEPPKSSGPTLTQSDDASKNESEKDSSLAEAALDSLKAGINKNAVQYTIHSGREKGEVRNVLWVKGITAPELSEFREVTDGSYVVRQIDYQPGMGWYDVNKSKDGKHKVNDDYLCFAAVASNMLHWWMDQNDADIQEYIEQQEQLMNESTNNSHLPAEKIELLRSLRGSFTNQQDSELFRKFTREFGHLTDGFQADLLVDMLINGYSPKVNGGLNDDDYPFALEELANNIDPRGGLFYPIFGGKKVTDRIGSVGNYEQFGSLVKRQMSQGNLIGLVYQTLGKSAHIVTVWGAEFDLKGRLVAVYISDSDDQNEGNNVGMKRLEIRNVDNRAKLGSDQSNLRAGSNIDHIHIMLSGEGQWKR